MTVGNSVHILQLPVFSGKKDEYSTFWHCCIVEGENGCKVFSILGIRKYFILLAVLVTVVVMEGMEVVVILVMMVVVKVEETMKLIQQYVY